MSDVDEDVGNIEEEEKPIQASVSRRTSFVERKRQMHSEASEDDELPDDEEQNIKSTAAVDVSNSPDNGNEYLEERHQSTVANHEHETENDAALYDEVDQDWAEPNEAQPVHVHIPSENANMEDTGDIPEYIPYSSDPVPDFPAPAEVEEIIEDPSPPENNLHEQRDDFELTQVTDDVVRASPRQRSHIAPTAEMLSSGEKGRQMSVLEERAAVKLQQVEAAEELAMAAEQAKAARKEALRQREVKRHEDFLSGQKKESVDASIDGGDSESVAASKHKQFLPHIPKRVRAGANKSRAGEESDIEESSAGDHSNGHHHEAAQDPTNASRALRSKSLVSRVRRNKLATAAGDDSVENADDKNDKHSKQPLDGVGIEGSSLSRNPSHDPKPPRRKVGGVAGRPGRRVASSTTDDTEARDGAGLHLPPLVQPRSSPDPSQYGDAEGMSSTENGDNSQKGRKHRKPLFLRMIERAQQQTLEDEKQKHEQYVQQKKIRQKNNPSAEELREHRQKHDELMRAKQDEARRNMAEAAAANAKAMPVKKEKAAAAAVAAAEAPVAAGVERDQLVTAASSLPKKKKKKVAVASNTAGIANRHGDDGELDLSVQGAAGAGAGAALEKHSAHNSSSSPTKKARGHADSPVPLASSSNHKSAGRKETSTSKISHSSPTANPEELFQPSPVRKLNFDAAAASRAVAALPELTAQSVTAFCSPDWLAAFARVDLDEVNNDRETKSTEPPADLSAFLQPAPPTIEACKLMYGSNV